MNTPLTFPLPPKALGLHIIADFYGALHLYDSAQAEAVLTAAAKAAGATVLHVNLHDFGERFGFTGVALLAESHISIHTWPENDFAAIDIFMCGDARPEQSLAVLRDYFAPKHETVQHFHRGRALLPADDVCANR